MFSVILGSFGVLFSKCAVTTKLAERDKRTGIRDSGKLVGYPCMLVFKAISGSLALFEMACNAKITGSRVK